MLHIVFLSLFVREKEVEVSFIKKIHFFFIIKRLYAIFMYINGKKRCLIGTTSKK